TNTKRKKTNQSAWTLTEMELTRRHDLTWSSKGDARLGMEFLRLRSTGAEVVHLEVQWVAGSARE
ncbi:hypothetical protein Csa_012186, partial [Cucumis sativus]